MRAAVAISLVAALGLMGAAQATAKKRGTVSTVTAQVPLAPGAEQAATVRCPKGKHITGGGWADSAPYSANGTSTILGDDSGLRILNLQSQPNGLVSWTAGAAAFTVPPASGTFSSIARCETKSVSRTALASPHTSPVQVNSEGTIDTRCPQGTHVLTGGFSFSPAGNLASPTDFRGYVVESRRLDRSTWEIDLVNPAGAPAAVTLNTSVLCELNRKGVNVTERSALAPLVDNSRATATASCTGKTHSVGGGFLVNPKVGPSVGVDQMQPVGQKGWQVGLYEAPGFTLPPGSTVTAYSYCRKN
jgi:hypothetical protein